MKRFYQHVTVAERDGGVAVMLDGRPVRTPRRRPLVVTSPRLAEAIAAEWAGQGARVLPRTMGLTRLAATAIDVVGADRAKIVADVAGYAGTDLVCYRAAAPADLVDRQRRTWGPLLDWLAERYDVRLAVTQGVVPIDQGARALAALRRVVCGYDDGRLAALAVVAGATGSLVVGLALVEGRVDADGAFAAGQLDETYEIELWGDDAEATAKRDALRVTIADAARFLSLL